MSSAESFYGGGTEQISVFRKQGVSMLHDEDTLREDQIADNDTRTDQHSAKKQIEEKLRLHRRESINHTNNNKPKSDALDGPVDHRTPALLTSGAERPIV